MTKNNKGKKAVAPKTSSAHIKDTKQKRVKRTRDLHEALPCLNPN